MLYVFHAALHSQTDADVAPVIGRSVIGRSVIGRSVIGPSTRSRRRSIVVDRSFSIDRSSIDRSLSIDRFRSTHSIDIDRSTAAAAAAAAAGARSPNRCHRSTRAIEFARAFNAMMSSVIARLAQAFVVRTARRARGKATKSSFARVVDVRTRGRALASRNDQWNRTERESRNKMRMTSASDVFFDDDDDDGEEGEDEGEEGEDDGTYASDEANDAAEGYGVAEDDEVVIKVNASADAMEVGNFGMSDVTVAALRKRGVDKLFPIQQAVLKPALEGLDVVGRARTGTGKTLAFALPVIERLLTQGERRGRNPKCIVLAPTRELAKQVENEIFITAPTLATTCVYGGTPIGTQESKLRRGVDIVVGTPGRVQDLMNRGSLNLSDIEFVVLDEADQMLNVGFEEDVEAILRDCPESRQTFLFSATMPSWVKQITRKFLKPGHVVVDLVGDSRTKLAETIELMSCVVSHSNRTSIVMDLVTVYAKDKKAICFTQTKRAADELTAALSRRITSEVLHGDIAQAQRERTLQRFRDNRFTVLIATDVAARGLDISDVDLVIHYELPNDVESFVHRCGRTGRAGQKGAAIAMYTDRESHMIRRIKKETGAEFITIGIPSSTEVMDACAVTASNLLAKVDDDLLPYFTPAAKRLLPDVVDQEVLKTLSAALAALSGHTEAPPPRSLLTGAPNSCTYMIIDKNNTEPAIRAGDLLRALTEIDRKIADGCGKIRFIEGANGMCFDVDAAYMSDLESVSDLNGFELSVCRQLPELIAEQSRGPRTGFSGGRGGRGGRGFDRDRRGGGYGGYGGRDGGFRGDREGGGRGFRGDRDGGGGGYRGRSEARGDGGGYRGRGDRDGGYRGRGGGDRDAGGGYRGGERSERPPRRSYGDDGYAPSRSSGASWGGWSE